MRRRSTSRRTSSSSTRRGPPPTSRRSSRSLDLAYPGDYLLAETWERLRRAFTFLDNLNAGAATATTFAAATMTRARTRRRVKELLRSKFGAETWLTLSAEIQDVLRERKRDALAAYLLTQPQAGRRAQRQVGEHQRSLRLLPARRGDVVLPAHQPPGAGIRLRAAVRAALLHGTRAGRRSQRRRRRRRQRLALVEVDAQVPRLGGEPQGVPLAGELDRAGAEEGPLAVLQGPRERAAAERDQPVHRRDGVRELSREAATASRSSRSPASTRRTTATTRSCTCSGARRAPSRTSTTTAATTIASGRRGRRWTSTSRATISIPAVVDKRLFLFWPVFTEVPDEDGEQHGHVPQVDRNQPTTFDVDKAYEAAAAADGGQRLPAGQVDAEARLDRLPSRARRTTSRSSRKHYQFYPDRPQRDRRPLRRSSATATASTEPTTSPTYVAGLYRRVRDRRLQGRARAEPTCPATSSTPSGRKIRLGRRLTTDFMKWVGARPSPRATRRQNDFTLRERFAASADDAAV